MMATKKMLDFTDVKERNSDFNTGRIPQGDYKGRIVKVEDDTSKNKEPMWIFHIKVDKHASRTFPYYCVLNEKQLWKVRNLFVAAGVAIPRKKMSVDPGKIVKRVIGVSIEDDEYTNEETGKTTEKSVVGSVFPATELGVSEGDDDVSDDTGDDDTADDDLSDVSTPIVDDVDEEEDEETALTADEFDAMDRSALKSYIRERDAEFKFLKSLSDDDLRGSARKLPAPEEEEDEEEEEEEVVEVKPAPRRRKAKPKPAEDEELDIEDL